jgi:rRNA maturation protein Nop10
MTHRKLKPCRKCQVTPTEERVELYGIMQIKISCPQCGLSVYAPPTAKISISDRWNRINSRRSSASDFRLLTQAKRSEMAEQADFADLINSRNTPIGYLAEECHNGTPYEELY